MAEKRTVTGIDYTFYALSVCATREDSQNRILDHAAFSSDAATEKDAIAEVLKKAEAKWPASQGWETNAKAETVRFSVDFH